ncbi:MAG: hypothetical protein RLT05_05110 [Bauldia litoralis]
MSIGARATGRGLLVIFAAIGAPQSASAQGWTSAKEMQGAVLSHTSRYFEKKDAARFGAAYSFFGQAAKTAIPYRAYLKLAIGRRAKFGALRARRVTKVSWYQQRTRSGAPNVYAAVDLTSTFDKLLVHCSYLVWQVFGDRRVVLIREQISYLTKEVARSITASKIRDLRKRLGCKD